MKPTPVDTNDILEQMEKKLSELAYYWRSSQETQLAQQYQAILRCMIELGFDAPLDIDAELPDRLMPQEYLDLHR
jgi:hypothetical protein